MFFPNGTEHYIIGGLLIGLATATIFLLTGIRAGASSVFSSTFSYFSDKFKTKQFMADRKWRLFFSAGIILGALLWTLYSNSWFSTEVQWWRLLIGGFLVGIGTRMARGCTSGHGVSGLSAGSVSSLVAVCIFMVVAIATAISLSVLGVFP